MQEIMGDEPQHELLYRVGSHGLGYVGIADNNQPHWYCSCGQWRLNRNPRTGSPFKETATKHHKKHIKGADTA